MRKAIDWEQVKARLKAAQAATDGALQNDPKRMEEVFAKRAERLARSRSSAAAAPGMRLLEFMLGAERYAIELSEVAEVVPLDDHTPVPGASAEIVGVFNLRGEIVPIVDLAAVLGLAPTEGDANSYLLLLRRAEHEVALKVGQVSKIAQVRSEELCDAREALPGSGTSCVKSVTRDAVSIVNVDVLLERSVFAE